MLNFECKNLGTNCSYVASGKTVEEVKQNAMRHAQTLHKDMLAKMTPKQIADIDKIISTKTH